MRYILLCISFLMSYLLTKAQTTFDEFQIIKNGGNYIEKLQSYGYNSIIFTAKDKKGKLICKGKGNLSEKSIKESLTEPYLNAYIKLEKLLLTKKTKSGDTIINHLEYKWRHLKINKNAGVKLLNYRAIIRYIK